MGNRRYGVDHQLATSRDLAAHHAARAAIYSALWQLLSGTSATRAMSRLESKHAWARITPVPEHSRGWPFTAYAVVNDGAEPGEGTDDGSFISGIPE